MYLGQDSDSEVVNLFHGWGSRVKPKARVEMLGNVLKTWTRDKIKLEPSYRSS